MQLQTQLAWSSLTNFLQLRQLDKGLRESVNVQKEQLRAHSEMLRCSTEMLGVNRQLAELGKEATALQRQQLQAQLQQLQLQQQRNEAELRKEQRMAQENSILKLYVDLYSQAQSLKQQGRFLDCVIVTLGAFRVYQQVYSDLDDANNRLKVTELKDRLYGDLRDAVAKEEVQRALAVAYAEVLREPVALISAYDALIVKVMELQQQIAETRALNTSEAMPRSSALASEITELKRAASDLLGRYTGLTADVPADELFLPSNPERLGANFGGFGPAWNAWCERAAEANGTNIVDLRNRFLGFPAVLTGTNGELDSSGAQAALMIDVLGILTAAEALGAALPELRAVATHLSGRIQSLPPQAGSDPVEIVVVSVTLAEIQREADDAFGPFRAVLAKNKHANTAKFMSVAQRRAADSAVATASNLRFITEAFELDSSIATLLADVAGRSKRYHKALVAATASPDSFTAIEGELRRTLAGEQLERVDARVAAYRPGCIGRIMSIFKGQSGKDADNRRVIAEALIAERAAAGGSGPRDGGVYTRVDLPKLAG